MDILGAIVGDIAGSTFERSPFKFESCNLFAPGSCATDDTILTLATADYLLHGKPEGQGYADTYQSFALNYPHAGYGASFLNWMKSEAPLPYNSWGNGSAMRVSPIGWAFNDLEQVLDEAAKSAEATHNHPEGIKGAQAVASAIFLGRQGESKAVIRDYLSNHFAYDLTRSLDEIRPTYVFDVSCQGSVPESLIAFLESESFEDSIRKAISLGGDADTMAAIAGAVAQAFYGADSIPEFMVSYCLEQLDRAQQSILEDFALQFCQKSDYR